MTEFSDAYIYMHMGVVVVGVVVVAVVVVIGEVGGVFAFYT